MHAEASTPRRTVAFVTMGCAKNEVDSALMRARLLKAGYQVIEDAPRADAVIVNTCSFIRAGDKPSEHQQVKARATMIEIGRASCRERV